MLLIILGVIDILAGALLFLSNGLIPISNPLICLVGFVVLIKGVWSIISSFSVGHFLEWMGAIDLICGLGLVLIFFNLFTSMYLVWWIILLKGVYSLVLSWQMS